MEDGKYAGKKFDGMSLHFSKDIDIFGKVGRPDWCATLSFCTKM